MKLASLGRRPPRSVWFIASFDGPPLPSEQLLELFDCQPGVLCDTAHGVGVYRIVARDGNDAAAVTHDDLLALASYAESGLLKGPHGIEMRDAGDLRHYTATSTSCTSAP